MKISNTYASLSEGHDVGLMSDDIVSQARGATSIYLSSSHRVARSLGIAILKKEIEPGSKIPHEEILLERYSVSRTVIREGIKILHAKGFVISKTKVGTIVRDEQSWNFFDPEVLAWRVAVGLDAELLRVLREARLAVEPFAAKLSAERASADDINAMHDSLDLMREAVGDRKLFAHADLKFHQALAASTGNFVLNSFTGLIEIALVCSSLLLPLEDRETRENAVQRHAELVQAITLGNGNEAYQIMYNMIEFGAAVGELEKL